MNPHDTECFEIDHEQGNTQEEEINSDMYPPCIHSPGTRALFKKIKSRVYCHDIWSFDPECVTLIFVAMHKLLEDVFVKIFSTRKGKKRRTFRLSYKEKKPEIPSFDETNTVMFGLKDLIRAYEIHPYLLPNASINLLFRDKVIRFFDYKKQIEKQNILNKHYITQDILNQQYLLERAKKMEEKRKKIIELLKRRRIIQGKIEKAKKENKTTNAENANKTVDSENENAIDMKYKNKTDTENENIIAGEKNENETDGKNKKKISDDKSKGRTSDEKDESKIANEKYKSEISDKKDECEIADKKNESKVADQRNENKIAEEKIKSKTAGEKDEHKTADKNGECKTADKNDECKTADKNKIADVKNEIETVGEKVKRKKITVEKSDGNEMGKEKGLSKKINEEGREVGETNESQKKKLRT